jgi:hypothetical protein
LPQTTEHAEAKDDAELEVEAVEVDAMGNALEDMISPRPGPATEVQVDEDTVQVDDVQQVELDDTAVDAK